MKRAVITYRVPAKAAPYAEALRLVGAEPLLVSPDHPRDLQGIAGLLLSGGTDVAPALYGRHPDTRSDLPDEARDALEWRLLREALERDLPVLAICRGMQLLNVAHGGTLLQHLEGHSVRTPENPALPVHEVIVDPASRLASILGPGPHPVNSRHHQAVDRIGQGLVETAWSAGERVVEGLERPDRRFVVAVQWHPEDQVSSHAAQRHLFEVFAEALK